MNNVKFVYVKSLPSGPFSELKYMYACVCRKKDNLQEKKFSGLLKKVIAYAQTAFILITLRGKGKRAKE